MANAADYYAVQRTQFDPGMGLDEICDALNAGLYIGSTASGAPISSSLIAFAQSGSGAQARTMQAKAREIEVSVNDFSTIQQAIDAFRPASETTSFTTTVVIRVPDGDHEITAPINLYSGVKLRGTGEASKIVQGAGFAGTALVLLKGQGANAFCTFTGILDIGFECSGSTWSVKANASTVGNSEFKNIYLDAGFGIDLGTYAQECVIDTVYAGGSNTNQILHLKGNQNIIRNIDKEGSTGSSTDPYILLEAHSGGDSTGNTLDGILLEGTTSANKSLMKLSDCDKTTLDHLWFEPTSSDNYALRILNCIDTRIGKISSGLGTTTKLKVDTSENTVVDVLDINGAELTIGSVVEVDATSDLHINLLRNRRNADAFVLAKLDRNHFIDRSYAAQIFTDGVTGYVPVSEPRWLCGQNFALNGSFEAGRYGWAFTVNPTTTEEYITSEVGAGLMGHFVWAVSGSPQLTQTIVVPANMPVTVTAKVKMTAGTGWISPITDGVGITHVNGYPRANVSEGWQIITRTVIPTSAGNLLVGFEFVNATEVYVDEFSVSVGNVGVPNQGKFGTMEVGGKTQAHATAAPTGGTWKVGDTVFNSAPAVGQPIGWSCTVAGTPGTWVAWANL